MPPPEPGRTRLCPHCKATILESSDVCPACRHHLRFGADRSGSQAGAESLFRVEGTVQAPASGAWEYEVVVALYDEKGAEIAREVVNVGALRAPASRRCVVTVDARPAAAGAEPSRSAPLSQKLPGLSLPLGRGRR
jgi:hypothetical protein